MLIPDTTIALVIGMIGGVIFTILSLFLIGLLYRLDCIHLCSDEVDFEFEKATLHGVALHGTNAKWLDKAG